MDQGASARADGFRERGGQVTRLEAFVDAAFAVVVTLLVISGSELPTNVPELLWAIPVPFAVRSYEDIRVMFVVYAVAWATMGAIILPLYRHAWRQREALGLSLQEQLLTRGEASRWAFVPVTGALSIAVACTLPDLERPWTLGTPGMVYFLMWLMHPVDLRYARRVRRELGMEAGLA